jgi:hypothetical protein
VSARFGLARCASVRAARRCCLSDMATSCVQPTPMDGHMDACGMLAVTSGSTGGLTVVSRMIYGSATRNGHVFAAHCDVCSRLPVDSILKYGRDSSAYQRPYERL